MCLCTLALQRFDRFEHYGRLVVSDFRLRNLTGGTDKRCQIHRKIIPCNVSYEVFQAQTPSRPTTFCFDPCGGAGYT